MKTLIKKTRNISLYADTVQAIRSDKPLNFMASNQGLLEDGLKIAHYIIFEGMVPCFLEIEVLVNSRTYANKFVNYHELQNEQAELLLNHKAIMPYINWHYHNANKIGKYEMPINHKLNQLVEKNKNAIAIMAMAQDESFTALTESELVELAELTWPSYELGYELLIKVYTTLIIDKKVDANLHITTNDMYDIVSNYLSSV